MEVPHLVSMCMLWTNEITT